MNRVSIHFQFYKEDIIVNKVLHLEELSNYGNINIPPIPNQGEIVAFDGLQGVVNSRYFRYEEPGAKILDIYLHIVAVVEYQHD